MLFKNVRLRRLFVEVLMNDAFYDLPIPVLLERFPKLKKWEDGVPIDQVTKLFKATADTFLGKSHTTYVEEFDPSSGSDDEIEKDPNTVKRNLNEDKDLEGEHEFNKNLGLDVIKISTVGEFDKVPLDITIKMINLLILELSRRKPH
jgi:hypothetical protein